MTGYTTGLPGLEVTSMSAVMPVQPNPMPPVMPGWSPTCQYQYLYRLLRPDEVPHLGTTGITAKAPMSPVNEYQHVREGSYTESKYISTSATWPAVVTFAGERTSPAYAKINATQCKGRVQFLDLTIEEIRKNFFIPPTGHPEGGIKANNFASKFDEVLIQGVIPPSCITLISNQL